MASSTRNSQGRVGLRLTCTTFHRYRHVLSIFNKRCQGPQDPPQNAKICLKPMKWVFTLALLVLEAGLSYAAAPTKAKSIPTRSSHTALKPSQHSVSSGARTSGSAGHGSIRVMTLSRSSPRIVSSAAASSRSTRHTRRPRVAPPPGFQLQPDPDRYQEIQKALSEKGYFKGDVNGHWGDDSVDALKRFQADKGLTNDGKIDALSLIGLGLGPKHGSNGMTAAPAIPTAVPTVAPAGADAAPTAAASPSPPRPANRR